MSRTRSRWALTPKGRVAHKWRRGTFYEEWAIRQCDGYIVLWELLRPPGDAKRCQRCARKER